MLVPKTSGVLIINVKTISKLAVTVKEPHNNNIKAIPVTGREGP
jgi:hypothetical protein